MKKMNVISILAIGIAFVLCGCGRTGDTGPQGSVGPQGPVTPATPLTSDQQQILATITSENAYREGLGQTALTVGLSCSVQAVASGQWLSSSSPGYNAGQGVVTTTGTSYSYLLSAGFNQPNANSGSPNSVIDPSIQPLFLSNNYKIVCNGQVVVTEDGYHSFAVSSDDGAILTIDGTQVVNNDGTHGITTAVGTKNLRKDIVHSFSLQYAQSGQGQFALIVDMDGSVLPAENLYH